MRLEKIVKPGTTTGRKAFWDAVADLVVASQKVAGKNVSVDVREGYGSVINVNPQRANIQGGGGATSPCCFSDGSCEMLTTEDCLAAEGHPSDAENCDDPDICLGGCCDFLSSLCSVESLDDCPAESGNTWLGYGTDCTDVDCTCCPFFTFYTTLKFSGSVSGRCDVTFPEQTWTKVFPFPSNPGAHEFRYDNGCVFEAGTCDGAAANTFLLIDSDGTCDTDTAWMTADFGGACGPYVLFTVNVNDCDGGPIQIGGDEFKDFSSGSITIVYVVDDITVTFHLTAE